MFDVGSTVRIVKGCKAREVAAHTTARVVDVALLGPEYSYSVRVKLLMLNGFKANQIVTFYARHANRLQDPIVNLNDGNPSHTVQIVRVEK